MPDKPRVVYLDHVAQLSGAELALLRLLPAMIGVAAHVILAEDGPLVAKLQAAGVSCEVLPIQVRTARLRKEAVRISLPVRAVTDTVWHCLALARRLRELDADLVHTNSMKAHIYGGIAARLAGVPQVWHLRDRVCPDYLPASGVRLVRLAGRILPSAVVANSAATLETLRRRGGRQLVVPSPLPAQDEPLVPPVPAHPFTVGVVGRLANWKGQDVFLRAFAKAFGGGDERAVIVGSAMFGESAFADMLLALAQQLGIADRVEFAGFIEDVRAQLRRFDVLVHCSTVAEPFGQVVLEGMAAGLPVIATNCGGPAEIIEDGVTGLLTSLGDIDALAAALRTVYEDPELAARLGAAARERVSGRYLPEPIAAALTELYRDVLADRAVRSRLPLRRTVRMVVLLRSLWLRSVKRRGSRYS